MTLLIYRRSQVFVHVTRYVHYFNHLSIFCMYACLYELLTLPETDGTVNCVPTARYGLAVERAERVRIMVAADIQVDDSRSSLEEHSSLLSPDVRRALSLIYSNGEAGVLISSLRLSQYLGVSRRCAF